MNETVTNYRNACDRLVKEFANQYYNHWDGDITEWYFTWEDTWLGAVSFEDDTFATDRNWFKEFAWRYSQEIQLPFCCNLRPALVDEELVQLLKDANFPSIPISSLTDFSPI